MRVPKIWRPLRLWWQRRTRGWDDSETWSLDHSLAKHILPRLIRFKELNNGYPSDLSAEEWDAILDTMIAAFTYFASDDRWDDYDTAWDQHQEGLELFSKWYTHLWW